MTIGEHISKGPSDSLDRGIKPNPREENTQGTLTSGGAQPPADNPISSIGMDGDVFDKGNP